MFADVVDPELVAEVESAVPDVDAIRIRWHVVVLLEAIEKVISDSNLVIGGLTAQGVTFPPPWFAKPPPEFIAAVAAIGDDTVSAEQLAAHRAGLAELLAKLRLLGAAWLRRMIARVYGPSRELAAQELVEAVEATTTTVALAALDDDHHDGIDDAGVERALVLVAPHAPPRSTALTVEASSST